MDVWGIYANIKDDEMPLNNNTNSGSPLNVTKHENEGHSQRDDISSEAETEEESESGEKGDDDYDGQTDSGVRFSLNIGKDLTKAKICRLITSKERRKDTARLYDLFHNTFKDVWRDISKDGEEFPLIHIRSMKMDTRSESSGISLEGGYTQKDVSVYRYDDQHLTLYIYRVGMGGKGGDSSLKSGGTGVEYGVPVGSFIPSKPEGDYTKMFLYGFTNDKLKLDKKSIVYVKFPINSPPFSYVLASQNTGIGQKLKDKFTLDSSKKGKSNQKEDGPFLFFGSSTHQLPSIDTEEKKFWAFCFNRSNLLYIIEVHYDTKPATEVITGAPPISATPPSPLQKGKTNVESNVRFKPSSFLISGETQIDLETNIGEYDVHITPWFKSLEYKSLLPNDVSLKNNTFLYPSSQPSRELISSIFEKVGTVLNASIKRGSISIWAFSPMYGYKKDTEEPGETETVGIDLLHTKSIYLIQNIFESDMIQKILKVDPPMENAKGHYIGLLKWLQSYHLNNTIYDFKSMWFQNFFALSDMVHSDRDFVRFLPKHTISRTSPLFTPTTVHNQSTFWKYRSTIWQIFTIFSCAHTIVSIIHRVHTAYGQLMDAIRNSMRFSKNQTAEEHMKDIASIFPIVPIVQYNYDVIPGLYHGRHNYPYDGTTNTHKENFVYSPEVNTRIILESMAGTMNVPNESIETYFSSFGGKEKWIKKEDARSKYLISVIQGMSASISMEDTFKHINNGSLFGCQILSYIDFVTYAHYIGFGLSVGSDANLVNQSLPNLVIYGLQSLQPLVEEITETLLLKYLLAQQNEVHNSRVGSLVSRLYQEGHLNVFYGKHNKDIIPYQMHLSSVACFFRILLSSVLKTSMRSYQVTDKEEDIMNGSWMHKEICIIMDMVSSENMSDESHVEGVLKQLTTLILYNFRIQKADNMNIRVPPKLTSHYQAEGNMPGTDIFGLGNSDNDDIQVDYLF